MYAPPRCWGTRDPRGLRGQRLQHFHFHDGEVWSSLPCPPARAPRPFRVGITGPTQNEDIQNLFHHCYSSRFWKGRWSVAMSQRNLPQQQQQQLSQEGRGSDEIGGGGSSQAPPPRQLPPSAHRPARRARAGMRSGGQLSGTPSQAAPTPSTSPSRKGRGSDEIRGAALRRPLPGSSHLPPGLVLGCERWL